MRSACLMCGRLLLVSASRWQSGRGRFCSRQCAGRYRTGPRAARWSHGRDARARRRCARCGTMFSGKQRSRFCSTSCAKRPKTVFTCLQCGASFHPRSLKVKYCSWVCRNRAQRVQNRKPRQRPTRAARRAQSMVAYQLNAGKLVRPSTCDECGATECRIEAAHFNYDEPLRVRWLCCSCHRRWDRRDPKNGTVVRHAAEEKAPADAEARESCSAVATRPSG